MTTRDACLPENKNTSLLMMMDKILHWYIVYKQKTEPHHK